MKIRLIVIILCVFTFLYSPIVFAEEASSVEVYYFHTAMRCPSCHKIQQFTEEALQEGFPEELKSGELKYQVINVEEPGNEHYVEEYGLYTKSVVLSLQKGGKEVEFKNLDKIWQLLNNKNKFVSYIQGETKSFVDAK
ncbi:MAG: nitrophenyl compound nitroreductase subunit ArsF family protein [Candidatus Omnitrophota bacterium]